MRNKITVVGLDLSLTSSGVACQETRFTVTSSFKGVDRLVDVNQQIMNFLGEIKDPGVVIEGYSFASRNSHAHSIGELGGVIRFSLKNLGIPFVEVPPTCRAKFATGRGNASKSEVVSAISARTALVWEGKGADDMCDAFILEEMGLAARGEGRFTWPETHLVALKQIDWTPILGSLPVEA